MNVNKKKKKLAKLKRLSEQELTATTDVPGDEKKTSASSRLEAKSDKGKDI